MTFIQQKSCSLLVLIKKHQQSHIKVVPQIWVSPLWPRGVCLSRFDYMDLLKQTALLWNREQKHVSGKWGQIWVLQQFPDTQYFHLFSVLPLFLCDMCPEIQVKVHNDQCKASLWCLCTNLTHAHVTATVINLSTPGTTGLPSNIWAITLKC